jgi:hypothetical protein
MVYQEGFAREHHDQCSISMAEVEVELARKRKALDKEIERFMAQKEAEFRKFEKELRGQVDAAAKEGSTIVEKGFSVGVPLGQSNETAGSKAEAQSLRDTNKGSAVQNSSGGQLDSSFKYTTGYNWHESKEDRELELRALFTPAFLPLLESSSYNYDRAHRRSLSTDSRPPKEDKPDSTKLSSSLTSLGSPLKSNVNIQPRPGLADRRSSSSPTGTGRSLRKSSLRQPASPDHVPRERKHVLFSIDNVVISPSSSPVVTRTADIGDPSVHFADVEEAETGTFQARQNEFLAFSGGGQASITHSKAEKKSKARQRKEVDPLLMGGEKAAIPLPLHPISMPTTTSYSRSYKDLVEPTITTPPEELAKEDFNLTTGDPLFDADETAPPLDEDEWDTSGKEEEEEGEEKSGDEQETPIAASPRVGSIPIEIRWPNRRF